MEDYEFDVFLSYKRHERIMPWISQVYEQISYWLTQELDGYQAKIFFDQDTIETGSNWPEQLRLGVKKSRCMVGIWSPEYFRSRWCVAEWRSFYERQLLINNHTYRIILPVRFHDGDSFPKEARALQSYDVRKYTSLSPAFWETARAVEIEDKLKLLCVDIAKSVKHAPKYNSSWPTPEPEPELSEKVELRRL